jgi:transitional endoplasmic reticulum ATPase
LKRTILLEGGPGTGKTLTALTAAAKAEGWTVLYLKDVSYLEDTYRLAARYAPSLVIAEDLDKLIDSGGDMNAINNVLDGLDTKDKEIQLVLTTNYIEKIPKITLRMGRIHVLVHYDLPDAKTAALLVQQFGGKNIDYDSFDSNVVGDILAGSQPSTIRETIDRAMLLAGSTRGYPDDYTGAYMIGTREIELASRSLKDHRHILESETPPNPSAMQQFGDVVAQHIVQGVLTAAGAVQDKLVDVDHDRNAVQATRPTRPLIDGAVYVGG